MYLCAMVFRFASHMFLLITSNSQVGSIARYKCADGYIMQTRVNNNRPKAKVRCKQTADGLKWRGKLPTCIGKLIWRGSHV